ncbi:hypothetical protein G6F60_013525 [Rhizopus arrhizus]|nr:hypothetical protein G6F60_013525 [Rhizopus arrhizus]
MRWRTSLRSAGSGCSASDCRASLPMMVVLTRRLMTKAARSAGRNTCASRISATISALAHRSYGLGCTGISTRSAASSAERARAAMRGGPSMMT